MKSVSNDAKRIKGIIDNDVYIGPKRVNIHLNNYCNLNCIFCWYHSKLIRKRPSKNRNFDYNLLKDITDNCAEMGVDIVDLEGDGEPLLYPRIGELIKYIKGKSLKIKIYTNALFENFDLVNLRYVDYLDINLSATTAETYAKVHANGEKSIFPRVLRNLNKISKIRKICKNPNVTLTFVINELNYRELEKIIRLGDRFGFDRINFKMFEATQDTAKIILKKDSIKEMIFLAKEALKKGYKISNNLNDVSEILKHKQLKKSYYINWGKKHNDRFFYFEGYPYKDHGCYVGWFAAYIDLDYRVVAPCDNVGIATAGSINKKRFNDIWFSKKYKKIRQDAKDNLDINTKKWQECKYCHNILFNQKINRVLKEKV